MDRIFDWIYGFGAVIGSIVLIVVFTLFLATIIFILYVVIIFFYVAVPVILFILAAIFVAVWIYKKIRG